VTLVPDASAVYVWQKAIQAPPSSIAAVDFEEWLSSSLEEPIATMEQVSMSHYLSAKEVSLGGGPLPDEKVVTLQRMSRSRNFRETVGRALNGAAEFSPTLYVGETDCLSRRVWQHMSGETDFSERLGGRSAIDWNMMNLRYFTLPDPVSDEGRAVAKKVRTLVEYAVTRITLGTGVSRQG